jgi:hypothetical protein
MEHKMPAPPPYSDLALEMLGSADAKVAGQPTEYLIYNGWMIVTEDDAMEVTERLLLHIHALADLLNEAEIGPVALFVRAKYTSLQKDWRTPKERYADYLATDEWKARAAAAKERAGNRCQVCNGEDEMLDTHHRTYERLGNEDEMDLFVLCRTCHSLFHDNGRLAR